jgi:phosphoribosylanthranilate isomerase
VAIRHGAAALGLVSSMPSGPGVIDEQLIAEIAAAAPPAVATFLLTSLQDADAIVAQQRRCGTNTVQICDHVVTGSYAQMRRAMPGVKLVQVIHVTGDESVGEARRVAPDVDAILLDSGNQKLAVKELGGTGRTHDWDLSRRIVESVGVPVFLAGGLRRDNIATAIRHVRPFGVDLCSSLRTDGKLDEAKVAEFVKAAREA